MILCYFIGILTIITQKPFHIILQLNNLYTLSSKRAGLRYFHYFIRVLLFLELFLLSVLSP